MPYTPPSGNSTNNIGFCIHNPPEIEHAGERLAAAKADLEQLTERQNAIQAAVGEARAASNAAIWKRTPEIEALAQGEERLCGRAGQR